MTQTWMMTAPKSRISKRELKILMDLSDVKRWILAIEKGKNGYEHWQCRFTASDPELFERWTELNPWIHLEKAQTDDFKYERKEGRFWTSDDTVEILRCRFGTPRGWQQDLLKRIEQQSVREIDVILDSYGNKGKTWLTVHLWELGKALVVPRYSCTPEKLSAFVCSAYKGESIIIIDIPRAGKPTTALYECMEEVKDGLVFDPRYSGTTRDIRGVKLVVFTNHKLKLDQLSDDRWVLHGITIDGRLS